MQNTFTIMSRPSGIAGRGKPFEPFGLPTNLSRQQAFDALEITTNKTNSGFEYAVVNTAA
jgi:hypothetical protein